MNITTKYNLGDAVYVVLSNCTKRIVKCTACDNTGVIKIKGDDFLCPKCKGAAKHPIYVGPHYYIYTSGIIGKVEVAVYAEGYDNEPATRYMLDSTGVGSGNLWKEEETFPTKEAAQAFCDEKNATLPPEDETEAK